MTLSLPALDIRPGIVLAAAAVALAPVAVFAPNGTVVLLAIAALTLALDPAHRRAAVGLLRTREVRLLLAFLIIAAVASLWSFDPLRGLGQALRLALLFAAGTILLAAALSLSPREARIARHGMAVAGLLLIGLMLIETASGAALTRFFRGVDARTLDDIANGAPLARGGTVLALFLWPALMVLPAWYGRWSVPLAAAAAAAALWLQPIEATVVAGLAGLAVFALAWRLPPGALRQGRLLAAALLLAPPLIAALLPTIYGATDLAALPHSHRHRVEIWTYALARIMEQPVFGWGFDASRELMGTGGQAVRPDAPMSLHTHNITLQAWMELGLAGLAVLVALAWSLWSRAALLGPLVAPAMLGGFAAALVYVEISRGAWQHWWLAALWLFAAWTAALSRPADP